MFFPKNVKSTSKNVFSLKSVFVFGLLPVLTGLVFLVSGNYSDSSRFFSALFFVQEPKLSAAQNPAEQNTAEQNSVKPSSTEQKPLISNSAAQDNENAVIAQKDSEGQKNSPDLKTSPDSKNNTDLKNSAELPDLTQDLNEEAFLSGLPNVSDSTDLDAPSAVPQTSRSSSLPNSSSLSDATLLNSTLLNSTDLSQAQPASNSSVLASKMQLKIFLQSRESELIRQFNGLNRLDPNYATQYQDIATDLMFVQKELSRLEEQDKPVSSEIARSESTDARAAFPEISNSETTHSKTVYSGFPSSVKISSSNLSSDVHQNRSAQNRSDFSSSLTPELSGNNLGHNLSDLPVNSADVFDGTGENVSGVLTSGTAPDSSDTSLFFQEMKDELSQRLRLIQRAMDALKPEEEMLKNSLTEQKSQIETQIQEIDAQIQAVAHSGAKSNRSVPSTALSAQSNQLTGGTDLNNPIGFDQALNLNHSSESNRSVSFGTEDSNNFGSTENFGTVNINNTGTSDRFQTLRPDLLPEDNLRLGENLQVNENVQTKLQKLNQAADLLRELGLNELAEHAVAQTPRMMNPAVAELPLPGSWLPNENSEGINSADPWSQMQPQDVKELKKSVAELKSQLTQMNDDIKSVEVQLKLLGRQIMSLENSVSGAGSQGTTVPKTSAQGASSSEISAKPISSANKKTE